MVAADAIGAGSHRRENGATDTSLTAGLRSGRRDPVSEDESTVLVCGSSILRVRRRKLRPSNDERPPSG
jgi:hypothetical protein